MHLARGEQEGGVGEQSGGPGDHAQHPMANGRPSRHQGPHGPPHPGLDVLKASSNRGERVDREEAGGGERKEGAGPWWVWGGKGLHCDQPHQQQAQANLREPHLVVLSRLGALQVP